MTDNRQDKVQRLYQALQSEGYTDLGSLQEFDTKMQDSSKRQRAYEAMLSAGYEDLGDFEGFSHKIVAPTQSVIRPENTIITSSEKPLVQPRFARTGIPTFDNALNQGTLSGSPMMSPSIEEEEQYDGMGNIMRTPKIHTDPKTGKQYYKDYLKGNIPATKESFDEAYRRTTVRPENGFVTPLEANDRQFKLEDRLEQIDAMLKERTSQVLEQANKDYRQMSFGERIAGQVAPAGVNVPSHFEQAQDQDIEVQSLKVAKRSIEQAQQRLKEAQTSRRENNLEGAVFGTGRGLRDKLFDVSTWDMGVTDAREMATLGKAIHKYESGKPLTEAEQMLLDAKATEMAVEAYTQSDIGWGYQSGGITAEALPFMLEMAVNPTTKAGKTLQGALLRYATKRFSTKVARAAMSVAGRVAGDTLGAATMSATTGSGRVLADAMQRNLGTIHHTTDTSTGNIKYASRTIGDDMPTALAKAFGARTIENFSEQAGEYLSPVAKYLAGKGGKVLSKGLSKIGADRLNAYADVASDIAQRIGSSKFGKAMSKVEGAGEFHGFFGELAEEIIGGNLNALVVGDQSLEEVNSLDNIVHTGAMLLPMSLGLNAPRVAGYAISNYDAKRGLKRADREAREAFSDSPEQWEIVKNAIDNKDIELSGELLFGKDSPLSDNQLKAALVYQMSLAHQESVRGKLSDDSATEEPTLSPYELEWEQSPVRNKDMDELVVAEMGEGDSAREVAVLRGRIDTDANGNINTETSSPTLVVRDREGKLEMISASDLRQVVSRHSREDYLMERKAQQEEEAQQGIHPSDANLDPNTLAGLSHNEDDGMEVRLVNLDGIGIVQGHVEPDQPIDDNGNIEFAYRDARGNVRIAYLTPEEINRRTVSTSIQPRPEQTMSTAETEEQTPEEEAPEVQPSVDEVPMTSSNLVGRSLTEQEAVDFVDRITREATLAPELDLTSENWDAEFGEDGMIDTPIGKVHMGENQFLKMSRQGREGKLGMIKPTLSEPDVIAEVNSQAKEGMNTERPSSYLFIKAFTKPDGSRMYYFTSVTVQRDGGEVVVSNQERSKRQIANILAESKVLWMRADNAPETSDVAQTLYSSQGTNLSDPTTEGTVAVQSTLSDGKDTETSTLAKIPTNESGEPMYEAVDATIAWDGLVESIDGDTDMAHEIANSQIAQIEAQLKKAQQRKIKNGTPSQQIEEAKAIKAEVQDLERRLQAWKAIASVQAERANEAYRLEKQALAEQESQRRSEERKVRQEQELTPNLKDDNPEDAPERGYIRSEDRSNTQESTERRRGGSTDDNRRGRASKKDRETDRSRGASKDARGGQELVTGQENALGERTTEARSKVSEDDGIRYRDGSTNEYEAELERIKSEAKSNGTFMLAPNGQPTNLNERQWLQVRTKAFKEWFGDWEKSARIEKLRKSEPIEITGAEIEPSDDIKQYKKNALEYGKRLQGSYVNRDTGKTISLQRGRKRGGLKEILQHDTFNPAHLQSIAAIPNIIESSIYIDSVANEDNKVDAKSFDYFVAGLNIGGVDYTVRMVVINTQNGESYYDHKLTQIEKGKLIDSLNAKSEPTLYVSPTTGLSSTLEQEATTPNRPMYRGEVSSASTSDIKDKRLVSILQNDSSKIVDENGEPMVVYHGTSVNSRRFFKFNSDYPIWVTLSKQYAQAFTRDNAKPVIYEVFAKANKPAYVGYIDGDVNDADITRISDSVGVDTTDLKGISESIDADKLYHITNSEEFLSLARSIGYDSIRAFEGGITSYAVLSPSQIKSATENVGAFDEENADIRYRQGSDTKSIVGVHNLSEDKLRKALRMGGLANPSVAVIDADTQTHEGYGDISLIMPSHLISKREGGNAGTWMGDAYTPTYPAIERTIGNDERVTEDILNLPNQDMQNEIRKAIDRWIEGRGGDGLEYLYLQQKGLKPEIKYYESQYPLELREQVVEILQGKQFHQLSNEEKGKLVDLYIQQEFDGDRIMFEEHMKSLLKNKISKMERREKGSPFYRSIAQSIETLKMHGYDPTLIENFTYSIIQSHRASGTVDARKTINSAIDYIEENGLASDYKRWLDGLDDRYEIKEQIFDGYTPSGRRRYYPHTLENASKLMKKYGRNGSETGSAQFRKFVALMLKPIGTLDKIRQNKHRLQSKEEVDAFTEKWEPVYHELALKLMDPHSAGRNYFIDLDLGHHRLMDIAQNTNPRTYAKSKYRADLSEEDISKLRNLIDAIRTNMPALYFETKFERPVGFMEIASAVVPNNVGPDIVSALEHYGIQVFRYNPNEEGARGRAFNESTRSSDNIRFRITTGDALEDNVLANSLYRINKEAKRFRDLRRYSFPQIDLEGFEALEELGLVPDGVTFDDAPVYSISTGEVDLKEAKRSLQESYANIAEHERDLEDEELDDDDREGIEEDLSYERDYVEELEEAIQALEEFEGLDVREIFTEQIDRLYDIKNSVLEALIGEDEQGLADGLHRFPYGDARYLYMLGDHSFHGRDISDEITREEYFGADELKEISSENLKAKDMSIDEAIDNVERYMSGVLRARSNTHSTRSTAMSSSQEHIRQRAEELASSLGERIRVVQAHELENTRQRRAKGWYDMRSGEVVLVLDNATSVSDAEATILHEVVGHKGLRELIGEDKFNKFLSDVIYQASMDVRREAMAIFQKSLDTKTGRYRLTPEIAMEEYIASLAERGFSNEQERTLWRKIVDLFRRMMRSIGLNIQYTEADIRYMLWRTYHIKTKQGALLAKAEDISKRIELGVSGYGQYATAEQRARQAEDYLTEVNDRFNDELQAQLEGTLPSGHIYQLGMPSQALIAGGVPNLPIELIARKLEEKSSQEYKSKHPFELSNITNLPQALAKPIAIFHSKTQRGSRVVLTELQDSKGNNSIVALQVRKRNRSESLEVEINSVRSIYPKESKRAILSWIGDGLMSWVDKNKALNWIGKPQSNSEDVTNTNQSLISATKVVQEFENPKAGTRHRESNLAEVNDRFNEQLAELTEENANRVNLSLGMPNAVLQSAGIEAKEMKLYGNKVIKKMRKHGFSLNELHNLPRAVAEPIAVFDNIGRLGNRSILTELRTEQGNFLVTIDLGKGQSEIDFNIVSSVFGKSDNKIVEWFNKGYATYIDKKKALKYLVNTSAPIAVTPNTQGLSRGSDNLHFSESSISEASNTQELSSATKIVQEFENPKASDSIRYREETEEAPHQVADWYSHRVRTMDEKGDNRYTENLAWRIREAHQDSMLSLKVLQEKIQNILGRELTDYENAYTFENLMSSRNLAAWEKYQREQLTPITQVMATMIKAGATREEISQYLKAKHGLERNAYMSQEAGLDHVKDFSGLTAITEDAKDFTAKAEQMVAEFESKHKGKVDDLWQAIRSATHQTLREGFESGMLSKKAYLFFKEQYQYYVPLRGWAEGELADIYTYRSNAGANRIGKVLGKKAHGRLSESGDPIEQIAYMANTAIRQANRNRLVQRFYNMAVAANTDLLTVSEQWYVLDPNSPGEWTRSNPDIRPTDSPEEMADKIAEHEEHMRELASQGKAKNKREGLQLSLKGNQAERKQHTVHVMRNGKEYVVYVNGNPRVAEAVNGLTNPDTAANDIITATPQASLRILSGVMTSYNPVFLMRNWAMDYQHATATLYVKEDAEYMANFQKTYRSLLTGLGERLERVESGQFDPGNELDKYLDEFLRNGGETGYTQILRVHDLRKELNRELNRELGNRDWKHTAGTPLRSIEHWNRIIELRTRFATYVASRRAGRTVERSAFDAKEVTVNFNKKGEGSMGASQLKYLYLFVNPSIQSTRMMISIARHNPAKFWRLMAGVTAVGMTLPLMMFAFMDDDQEERYWDLNEHVRKNNILIPMPGGKFLAIPVPHMLRPAYGLGASIVSVMYGRETASDAALSVLASVADVFLPLNTTDHGAGSNAEALLLNIAPSTVLPIAEALLNRDFYGREIETDERWNEDMPSWTKARKQTAQILIDASRWLNEMTGGDKYTSGWLDISPAKIQHIITGYTGGVGKLIASTFDLGYKLAKGEMPSVRETPFVNAFAKEGTPGAYDRNAYWELDKQLDSVERRAKNYAKEVRSGSVDAPEYLQRLKDLKSSPEYRLWHYLDGGRKASEGNVRKYLENLYKLKKTATPEEVEAIEAQERKVRHQIVQAVRQGQY